MDMLPDLTFNLVSNTDGDQA